MSLLDIVSLPDPVLRRKARKVTVFDKELQTLIDNMIHTMREAPGVGLAAPQVGESIRLVVVEIRNWEWRDACRFQGWWGRWSGTPGLWSRVLTARGNQ